MLRPSRGSVRRAAALLAGLALVVGALPASGSRAGSPRSLTREPTVGPLESGREAYVRGTYAWTDYAYDDHGANTSPGTAGAATYPLPQDQSNAADLIQLQARLAPGGLLTFTAVLETLTRPDEPLLGIGLDTDGSTATGARSLPGGQWRGAGALGLDFLVVASSDGGALSQWVGGAWRRVRSLPTRVDVTTNTVTTTLPVSAVGAHRALRAVAALGLRRAEASWLTGAGPIYDLAFVRAEEPTASSGMLVSAEVVYATGQGHATGGVWQDIRQADVLSGNLPANRAVATIDLDAMRAGRTSAPRLDTPGYHTMLYRSHVDLPEGIVDGTAAGGLWAGPYQPYLVQVPPRPTAGLPVLLYLHGGGQNHLDNGLFAPQGDLSIGRAIAVFPYGRVTTTAQDHGYHGVSEQDVLDVLADVRRHYATDRTRTLSVGTSTGGGGAWRLAQLHPDLFSGVLVISAYDDTHVPENLINVPVVLHNGGTDPAVSPPVVALTHKELDDLGDVGYRSYTFAGHSHADPAAAVAQCLLDQLLRAPGVRDPARVVLALDPANDPPGLPAGTRLEHDNAYWLSDVTIRPGAAPSIYHTPAGDPPGYGDNAVARIDVTSLAFADRAFRAVPVESVGENVTGGADACGPAQTRSNDAWRVHGIDLVPAAPLRTSNGATLSLREVSRATLDLVRMRLRADRPLTFTVTGDGPATLRLKGRWTGSAPVQVWRDGVRLEDRRPRDGVLSLTADLSGSHTLRLVPAS